MVAQLLQKASKYVPKNFIQWTSNWAIGKKKKVTAQDAEIKILFSMFHTLNMLKCCAKITTQAI